jgi:hypothetical protein
VVYHVPDAALGVEAVRCRLATVDLATGRVGSPRTVCAGRDEVVGLALDDGRSGAGSGGMGVGSTAYLAVWRRPAGDDCSLPSGSRILALRPETGATVATAPIDGVPGELALAAAPEGHGRRLYALEATITVGQALPDECRYLSYDEHRTAAAGWTVLGLSAATLEVESRQTVSQPLHGLAVAPDGADAYALTDQGAVIHLDLVSRRAKVLATLPDVGVGLAVTADRVYVPHTFGDAVWALDRRDGRRLQTIPTGRRPLGVSVGAAHPR